MAVLSSAVSALSTYYEEQSDPANPEHVELNIVRLLAKLPVIAAYAHKKSIGQAFLYPDNGLSFVDNFLRLNFGVMSEPYEVNPVMSRALERLLILHEDHEQNASTSTVRLVGSTGADQFASVSAGIHALSGPLHGGANEAVLHIMNEIGSAEHVVPWLDEALAEKRKIMGFGHRVYKKGDSRVPTMKAALDTLVEHYDRPEVAALYTALESEFVARKGIYPNLDYPSGPAYNLIGFDTLTFTPLFIASRVTGWTAHIMEQAASNALIRPLSAYNGPDERHIEGYVPDATALATAEREAEAE
jgi:citrate synthase